MRMQKEEKIVIVLLLMAAGSLAVAFWAFGSDEATPEEPREKETGHTVEGRVLEIKPTKSGGNLILRVEGSSLPVFIPASSGAGDVQKRVHQGDSIRVTGTVSSYQGNDELKVARASDVQLQKP
jgi:DNA/RNA endonuclease YhcR with UshA esterase domain